MDESATVTGLLVFARMLYLGSGMVLVNAAVFRWLILPRTVAPALKSHAWRERFQRRLRTAFFAAAALLAVATVLWFWAVAAEMSGTSLHEALDRSTCSTVLFQTRFGAVCQARIALLALLIVPAWKIRHRNPHSPHHSAIAIEAAAGFASAALLISVAWTGHAGSAIGNALPWTLLADSVHLLAGAIWPAGLLFFAWILSTGLAREHATPLPVMIAIARRFSAVSLVAVAVLATTGLIDSFFLVRSFGALTGTSYGRVLCLKLALFAMMLVFAAWNRFRLLPLLGDTKNVTPPDRAGLVIGRLRYFVRLELVLAAGIVIIVAFLGTLPPPHS